MKQISDDRQDARDQQISQLLSHHQQLALSSTLPNVQVPIFDGHPIEYTYCLRSFENLIKPKTASDNARLFYLVQYTSGEVQDLMRSCLTMSPDEGYTQAKRLLKEKYGQDYEIAAAYVNRISKVTSIKSEDGVSLQTFSVLLTSCRNTLQEIGYINKVDNPDCLVKIIEKLPFSLRQRWREVADDITNNKSREITFDDVVKFVEARARVLNHPVFGKLNTSLDPRSKCKDSSRASFGIESKRTDDESKGRFDVKTYKCVMCNGDHILARCSHFYKESLAGRLKFVRKRGLCDNCLLQGHIAKQCPKKTFCKVSGC